MESSTKPILTLCIPTYQRAVYLRDLLASVELSYGNISNPGEIGILIADNASQDDTADVVAEFQSRLPIQYQKNPVNIGGDHNFHHLIRQVRSEYFWLIGDDETLAVETLDHVMTVLKSECPDLLILRGMANGKDWYDPDVHLPYTFSNYRDFLAYYSERNIWPVLGHSLISLNVVKSTCYDLAKQEQILKTLDIYYAHMYGLVNGLKQSNGKVVLSAVPAVLIRDRRAHVAVDSLVITKLWRRYLAWVGEEFHHPQIVKYGRKLDGPSQQFKARRRKFSAWRRRLWADFKARCNSNRG